MSNRLYALAAPLTGCAAASALFIRQRLHREARWQHNEDLVTWEGEGGKPAPVATAAVPPP